MTRQILDDLLMANICTSQEFIQKRLFIIIQLGQDSFFCLSLVSSHSGGDRDLSNHNLNYYDRQRRTYGLG